MSKEGEILLSIIIPAFNIDKYLSDCLNSLIVKSYFNLEVIVVNDGSIDSTGRIADKYASNYKHIRVIHQSNLGVSEARNTGFLNSSGEYIWFVDGDDIVQNISTLLEVCERCIHQSIDVIMFKIKEFNDALKIKESSLKKSHIEVLVFSDVFKEMVFNNQTSYFVFDKIIKKSILVDNGIFFDKRYAISEDFIWNCNVFPFLYNCCMLEDIFYNHRKGRIHSATYELTDAKAYMVLSAINESFTYIESAKGLSESYRLAIYLYISRVWFYILPEIYFYSRFLFLILQEELIEIYSVFKKNKLPLHKLNKGAVLLNLFIKLLGVNFGVKCYAMLVILKRKN